LLELGKGKKALNAMHCGLQPNDEPWERPEELIMAEYEIYALKYAGPVTGPGAILMWLKDWERVGKRYYYLWCIKGNDELVVVDSGVGPGLAKEKDLPDYASPSEVLSRIAARADEVRHVVLTHLHWDHAGGVSLFPNATLYVQEEEYRFWLKDPLALRPPFRFLSDEGSKDYLAALDGTDRLKLTHGDQEILPGIQCLLAPGHTVALQVVAVNTARGTAILGSDCGHSFRNYREDWPSVYITNLVEWMKTYDKLRDKASSIDLIFPGHDQAMATHFEEVAEGVTRLV
jgi:glyoxylase-like metal-dependent hydrolase (beta-lactamase superfamily II)